MGYLRRQAITAALTANALRPVNNWYAGALEFFPGWLTSELSLHLFAATAADFGREFSHGRSADKRALALGAASMAGLGLIIRQSQAVGGQTDSDLAQALGTDYREVLAKVHDDLDPVTPWKQLAYPFRVRHHAVAVKRNIAYAEHGKRGLLDIYHPRDVVEGAPVLIQVHGGGWHIGAKHQQGIPLMTQMAAAGWVCVAINYRLSPRAVWPDHLIDVKKAIAWVREHGPEYGADPSFVALTGGSAGGHLVALAGLTPNDPQYQPGFESADTSVQAVVPHYGIYDMAGVTGRRSAEQLRDRFIGPRVLRAKAASGLDPFTAASPIAQVNADAPPFYVVHGANDTLVDVHQARDFVGALREVSKAPVAYTELQGTQHAFDVFPSLRSQHLMKSVDRFLRWAHQDFQQL